MGEGIARNAVEWLNREIPEVNHSTAIYAAYLFFFRPSISRNFSIQPFNSISRYTFESEIRKPRSQPFNCHLRGISILFFGLRFPEISRFNHSTAFRAIRLKQKSENPEVNHSTAI